MKAINSVLAWFGLRLLKLEILERYLRIEREKEVEMDRLRKQIIELRAKLRRLKNG